MATSPKTAHAGGTPHASAQSHFAPSHHLRRIARGIVIRAALRGRISWFVALQMLALLEGSAA